MPKCVIPARLVEVTIKLIANDNRSLEEIAGATGVAWPWLQLFAAGKILNPGVSRVEALYEYLSGKRLKL